MPSRRRNMAVAAPPGPPPTITTSLFIVLLSCSRCCCRYLRSSACTAWRAMRRRARGGRDGTNLRPIATPSARRRRSELDAVAPAIERRCPDHELVHREMLGREEDADEAVGVETSMRRHVDRAVRDA